MSTTSIAFSLRASPSVTLRSPLPDGRCAGSLEEIVAYVEATPGAAVTQLDASGRLIASGRGWQFSAPIPGAEDEATQGVHFLRMPTDDPLERFAYLLQKDERVEYVEVQLPETVNFPTLPPLSTASLTASSPLTRALGHPFKWAINQCRFSDAAWTALEHGTNPGAIVVIDNGGPNAGAPVNRAGLNYHPRPIGASSQADHAAAVVGMVAPHRGGKKKPAYGCSSARVELFNVFDPSNTIDKAHLAAALMAASKTKTAVVNMSFALETLTRPVVTALNACLKKGIFLVGSMGESAAPEARFPAKHKGVIAVGGTTTADTRNPNCLAGEYMFMCAPAESIDTVGGRWDGTSFSAPMVSAAVWLARNARPDLSGDVILDVLTRSVVLPPGSSKSEVGFGRLDIEVMRTELGKVPLNGR